MIGTKSLAAVCLVALWAAAPAPAQHGRQYYSPTWQRYGTYYYRHYYYKPTPNYTGYRHHYVIHYPHKPRHYYYYNSYTGKYWGRFDRDAEGYSMLDEADRKEKLADIPEKAFPKPGAMPKLPESEDNLAIDKPPEGLPAVDEEEVAVDKMKGLAGKEGVKDQSYSDWVKADDKPGATPHYYCSYYARPTPAAPTYKVHRVYYYPSKPNYVYYYNPVRKRYWGRYDIAAGGYSLLDNKDRKEKLEEIPETAFPKPGEMPPVPDSDGKTKMLKPPTNLPK